MYHVGLWAGGHSQSHAVVTCEPPPTAAASEVLPDRPLDTTKATNDTYVPTGTLTVWPVRRGPRTSACAPSTSDPPPAPEDHKWGGKQVWEKPAVLGKAWEVCRSSPHIPRGCQGVHHHGDLRCGVNGPASGTPVPPSTVPGSLPCMLGSWGHDCRAWQYPDALSSATTHNTHRQVEVLAFCLS